MKHSRKDYDRIQDPALGDPSLLPPGGTPIGEDEPVFLLRGRDAVAPRVVRLWAHFAMVMGASPETVQAARDWAQTMLEWQLNNGSKVPDLPLE